MNLNSKLTTNRQMRENRIKNSQDITGTSTIQRERNSIISLLRCKYHHDTLEHMTKLVKPIYEYMIILTQIHSLTELVKPPGVGGGSESPTLSHHFLSHTTPP